LSSIIISVGNWIWLEINVDIVSGGINNNSWFLSGGGIGGSSIVIS
jgi:hypothetical protein